MILSFCRSMHVGVFMVLSQGKNELSRKQVEAFCSLAVCTCWWLCAGKSRAWCHDLRLWNERRV